MKYLALPLALLVGCTDVVPTEGDNEEEVITTIELTFDDGSSSTSFRWADPEDDGSPVIDSIDLSDAATYTVTLRFLNELETPAEEITEEIMDEDDEHQVFFTGSAVVGPATGANASAIVEHSYSDMDADGLPVGLTNEFVVLGTGSGDLIVNLRHLPPVDDVAQKTAGLAADVAAGGFGSIAGDDDVAITFPVTVQ